jgi:aspartate/methionine/tyrosine aminotransferase
VEEIRANYQRRNVLVKGLHEAGWMVDVPKASMYIWARIPEPYRQFGSLEFRASCWNRPRSASRPASASANTATSTCASP